MTAGACAGTPPGVGGGGGGGGAEGGSDGGGSLAGRTFVSESVTEDGRPRPLVEGTRIDLTVADDGGSISAEAGCNILLGQLEITRHRLVVGDLSSTDMACTPERGDQDEWLAGFLAADPAYALHGPRLRLTVGTTVIELVDREAVDPDRPLEGTTWRLESIVRGDVVASLPAGTGATVVFEDASLLVAVDDCNRGSAAVEIGPSTIGVGLLRMSLMACEQHPAEVEAAVVGVLAGEVSYGIDADLLTLTRADASLVLRAVP